MNKRVLKIIGWVLAFLVVLSVGAAAGGGVVYALTQSGKPFALIGTEPSDPEPGIVIASVTPDGPAAEAGVARGDILLQVDGEPVDDLAELMRVLGEHEPGDAVNLTVMHGDDERTVEATLGDHDGRAYLGIVPCCGSFGPGREVFVRAMEPGALITSVEPDGPADQAGLEAGDVITAIDETELDGEADLADVIAAYEPGDAVTLEVKQPGEESHEVAIELGEHPEEEGVAYLGVRYQPSSPVRIHVDEFDIEPLPFPGHRLPLPEGLPHDLPFEGAEQGVIVRSVAEDSPAAEAGLGQGDVITAIDGEPVETPKDLSDAVAEREPGDQVTLTVYRSGEGSEGASEDANVMEIQVTLGEHPDEEGAPSPLQRRHSDGAAYLGVTIGGFFRIRRFEGGERFRGRYPFQFHFDFDAPFDEVPPAWSDLLDLDDVPHDFEFEFPPVSPDSGEPSSTQRRHSDGAL